jgi:catechol 2,3-dioxygenase-like lactoylglutathione lyase family enzyme
MSNSRLGASRIVGFAATTNVDRARAFYGDTLGLRLVSEDPFALVFDAGGNMLRVTPVREIARAPYTVLGWEVTDIAAKVAELAGAGVKFERYSFLTDQDADGIWTAPGGAARVAWFKDPDENLLSLSQH